jgi:hypothetical protein
MQLKDYKFNKSKYLSNEKDIWLLESIFGSDYLSNFMKNYDMEISEISIENLFKTTPLKFHVNKDNTRIYSENGFPLHNFYGDDNLTQIKARDALNYGLSVIETTMEKGTSKIFTE